MWLASAIALRRFYTEAAAQVHARDAGRRLRRNGKAHRQLLLPMMMGCNGLQLARLRSRTNYNLLLIVLTGENAGKASAAFRAGDSLVLRVRGAVKGSATRALRTVR